MGIELVEKSVLGELKKPLQLYKSLIEKLNNNLETLNATEKNKQIESEDKKIAKLCFEKALKLFKDSKTREDDFIALLEAIKSEYPKVFKMVLQEKNNYGNTLLHLTVLNKYPPKLAIKLMTPEGINLKGNGGRTPLHDAITKTIFASDPTEKKKQTDEQDTLVDNLIEQEGANLNIQDNEGCTPLHLAVLNDKQNAIEKLLAKRVDLSIKDNQGRTPLHLAINKTIFTYNLTEPEIKQKRDEQNTLVDNLIEKEGTNLNIPDDKGYTPLHLAVFSSNEHAIEKLLAKGVDLSIKDNRGRTPLYLAIELEKGKYTSNTSIIEKLLAKGGGLNIQDPEGRTPLHIAIELAEGSYTSTVAKLLENEDIDLSIKDKQGRTPLHLAIERSIKKHYKLTDDTSIIEKLLAKGGDLNIQDPEGRTPLHAAIEGGKTEITKKLMEEKGINLNLQDNKGRTPLHVAIEKSMTYTASHKKIASQLIEKKGINLNLKNARGKKPLDLAADKGYTDLVKELIKAGTNLNTQQPKGLRTNKQQIKFFKEAIKSGDLELIKKIAPHYKKLGTSFLSNFSGETLVSYANKHKRDEIAQYLLEQGFIPRKTWADFFARISKPKKAVKPSLSQEQTDPDTFTGENPMRNKKDLTLPSEGLVNTGRKGGDIELTKLPQKSKGGSNYNR